MRVLALIGVALMLQGCAIVVVQVADQPPRLSAWPLGVRVERGPNDAVSVDSKSVGLVGGCGLIGVGFQRCDQIRVDARTCGVAVIEPAYAKASAGKRPAFNRAARDVLARIADQARAVCLHESISKEDTK